MADRGIESWAAGLSARERVREIARTITQPRSVEWVRTEAGISSWQTAKDELEMLAEFGQVHAIEGDDGNRKYAPNYQVRYFNELAALINDHTRKELRDEIADLQGQIDEWKTRFDVESRDELESTLTEAELSGADVRTRNTVLRRWDQYDDTMRLVKHALELYVDARALYPGENDPSDSSLPLSQ